jgi:streptomycin 6-kinase
MSALDEFTSPAYILIIKKIISLNPLGHDSAPVFESCFGKPMQRSTSHTVKIPYGLRETVERVHGDAGRKWLAALPVLLNECCARWSLRLDEPFENLSYNLVLPGSMTDGTAIVLKVGVPCRELLTEAAALSLFDGEGATRLLAHDAPRGLLLMERVLPGTRLHELLDDEDATRTAAHLMRRLWQTAPANHAFPSLAVWFNAYERLRKRFDGGSGPFPTELIERAEKAFRELSASSDRNVILHGDLHHANILISAKRGWIAIDPKGIVGDPGYEVGTFMLNQLPPEVSESATAGILTRRLSIFSDELHIGRERLARWAFCHAVLSALWDFEESAGWQETIQLAQIIERLG